MEMELWERIQVYRKLVTRDFFLTMFVRDLFVLIEFFFIYVNIYNLPRFEQMANG